MTTNLWSHLNKQEKKADKLERDLQSACNALKYISIEDNDCFGDDFLTNHMDFSRETVGNNNARDKVGRKRHSNTSD